MYVGDRCAAQRHLVSPGLASAACARARQWTSSYSPPFVDVWASGPLAAAFRFFVRLVASRSASARVVRLDATQLKPRDPYGPAHENPAECCHFGCGHATGHASRTWHLAGDGSFRAVSLALIGPVDSWPYRAGLSRPGAIRPLRGQRARLWCRHGRGHVASLLARQSWRTSQLRFHLRSGQEPVGPVFASVPRGQLRRAVRQASPGGLGYLRCDRAQESAARRQKPLWEQNS